MNIGGIRSKFFEYVDIKDNGNSGSSYTIDWLEGNIQKIVLTDDCVFTFFRQVTGQMILIVECGQEAYTPTWPENVVWEKDSEPKFKANKITVCEFIYEGENYLSKWWEVN
jgi:hypothetical protein